MVASEDPGGAMPDIMQYWAEVSKGTNDMWDFSVKSVASATDSVVFPGIDAKPVDQATQKGQAENEGVISAVTDLFGCWSQTSEFDARGASDDAVPVERSTNIIVNKVAKVPHKEAGGPVEDKQEASSHSAPAAREDEEGTVEPDSADCSEDVQDDPNWSRSDEVANNILPTHGSVGEETATEDEREMDLDIQPACPDLQGKCPGACASCGGLPSALATQFLRCAKCRSVDYCSIQCQKSHWLAVHNTECASLANVPVAE